MLTLARARQPFVKFHQAYHFLPLPWKFCLWVSWIAALVGIFCGVLLGIGKLSDNLGTIILENGGDQTGVSLLGHVYNIDVTSHTVQISWLIIGCGGLQMEDTTTYHVSTCGRLNVPADFYVDGASLPSGSYDPTTVPVRADTTVAYVQALNQFQTTHLIEISSWNGLDQQYAYPFDTYFLDSSVVALNPNTNESLPVLAYYPVDVTNNFSPYVQEDSGTKTSINGTMAQSRFMRIEFRRTAFTMFFVMSLFTVNWALTAVVLYITLCGNEGMEVGESILLLPLSVIVTIPALRALWVGAPSFGLLLDSCGMFLQMVIVALCSIFLVVNVGLSSPQERELRKKKHRKFVSDVSETECLTMSDPEWKETHSLKAAQEMEMAIS
ncbi:hypothetical protein PHLGIDRAFT_18603 [Phlebiopsis gigantea 11061_1 CR5-6]|uniref:Transmembrane protein n=1 Tax=Phlebiopsis gigantea (strain 11061_1 CR5-6) TaxID=745531 RepID=A0A0C3SAT1_PHLG1|nr:hypothetical protein PHLGIDRAFT_18603 [Phlebiopsis gigantea 11061_1 CR5-6]